MLQKMIEEFDRTTIINLRDRADRRRGVMRELRKHGVTPDGDRIEVYTADRPERKGGFPTLGARGSFTSHLSVLRSALEQELESVLVMEDDVAIPDIINEYGPAIRNRLQTTDWDILYLGYLQPERPAGEDLLVRWDGPTIGGHFYAVHRRVLPRLVEFMDACRERPPGHPDGGPTFRDGAFNLFREKNPDVRTLIASPSLAGQRSSRTDLHELEWFDRSKLTRPLVSGARWVKNVLG
jgi:glycosyl transferase, family 25